MSSTALCCCGGIGQHCDFTRSDDTHTHTDRATEKAVVVFSLSNDTPEPRTITLAEDPYPSIQLREMLLNGFLHTFHPLVTVWMPVGLCHFHRPLSGWHKVHGVGVFCPPPVSGVNGSFWFALTISGIRDGFPAPVAVSSALTTPTIKGPRSSNVLKAEL